ncbi:hypothetical protein ACLB2K_061750 [Fragaria x ananassa]
MILELRSFGAPELFNSAPKCTYFAYNGEDAASYSVANAASSANRFDSVEAETSLIRACYLDSKAELAAQTKQLAGQLDRATATKLLHLCCNFDSADCASVILGGVLGAVPVVNECDDSGKSPLHTAASAHASRCVEVLLKKHARTDLRTKDGQAQLALELSLADTRTDPNWNLNDLSIEDLVIHMSEKDLSTVKLLSEKTKEIADVAYAYAVKGRIASLTALLIAAAEKVNDCVLELRDFESGCKEKVTLYECLIREALALGGRAAPPLRAAKRASKATEGENSERRKLLLREIELLQMFGAVAQSGGGEKKVTSPLIRAAQALQVCNWPLEYCSPSLLYEDTTTTTERNVKSSAKADVCKYFDSHRGCVRGAKCFYAHCEESRKVKEGVDQSYSFATKLLKHKVFVGGLPPSVDSDDLRKFCEEEFGSVEDAIVIVTQIENKIQSRGFGFVTFRQEKSASKAMRAHYITMRGKTVEIKSLIPKLVLGAEFEKMSPQREQEENFQLLQQKSNENIMEGDNIEQGSWADILVHGQSTVSSTEPQVTKSSEDPTTPTWLKVFKKWFPVFLKGLSNHPNYALSSLKADFRAKFALELDHSSVGYSKFSDFLKCFSNLCTVEMLPISKRRTPTHMILRPKLSRPKCRLLPTLGTPHNLSLSALVVNCGDSMCLSDLSTSDGGDSKCLENLTIDTCSDTKCLQDLTADNAVDSKCLEHLSLDFGGNSKCIEDLSICSAGEKFGSSITSHGEENPSPEFAEINSAEDEAHWVHPRFLQFLKPDPLLYWQKETDVLSGGTDSGKGQCSSGDKGSINVRHPRRHLVLESLSKKWSKSYFLREFDFYKNYKERLSARRCFACKQQKMLWANFPCKHLLWCNDCKLRAIGASGLFPHKCVLCDTEKVLTCWFILNMDPKVLSYNGVDLSMSDLDLLRGPYYLTDSIIRFYFSYLTSPYDDDILLVSPNISDLLVNSPDPEDELRAFAESDQLGKRKVVIFTVNDNKDPS